MLGIILGDAYLKMRDKIIKKYSKRKKNFKSWPGIIENILYGELNEEKTNTFLNYQRGKPSNKYNTYIYFFIAERYLLEKKNRLFYKYLKKSMKNKNSFLHDIYFISDHELNNRKFINFL